MNTAHDTRPERDDRAPSVGRHGRYEVRGLLGAGGMGIVLEGFDPDLERPVAIKLLHPDHTAGRAGAERLIREARAMARLAHPNVVPVYEVGWSSERVFLAMELVEGVTLRAWRAQRSRSWQEIIAMYVAAGRGLAAAHDAGMIHRDFKPDNVLIGADGRPRVTDFGLVIDAAQADAHVADANALDNDGATRATLVGTPAYMSPEQWTHGEIGPGSDQFAFCVALWEALHGERPFAGVQTIALREAVCLGELATPSGDVPRWIDVALRRGLATDPAARWPELADLLDELERRSRRARRGWRLLAGTAAVGAALASLGAVLVIDRAPAADPCPSPAARIDAVWNPARRDALAARLGPRLEATTRQIEAHVESWSAMHGEACRATHVRGEQSDALLDARMHCLDHRLGELDDTLQLVTSAADPEELDHATRALVQLTAIADCGDTPALTRRLALPPPPGRRGEIDELEQRIRRGEVDRRADRLTGLAERAQAAVESARQIGYAPTLAAALQHLGDTQLELDLYPEGEKTLRELIHVAAAIHDDRAEVRAWNHLIYAIGSARGQTADALALEPAAAAALARAGDPLDVRVEQLINLAQVLDAGPRVDEAIARLTEAKTLVEAALRKEPSPQLEEHRLDVLAELGNAYSVAGDSAAEIAALNEALAGYRALLGPDTLDEAMVQTNLGDALRRDGRHACAMTALEDAARITHAKTGESPRLAIIVQQMAYAFGEQDRWPEALAAFERALRIARTQIAETDPALAPYLAGYASALGHTGRAAEARHVYDAAIALFERGDGDINLPIALVNRADLDFEHGRTADATRAYTRAATLFEEQRGATTSYLLYPLVGLGRVHVLDGKLSAARGVLERAVQIEPDGGDRMMAAAARAWLGRALAGTRGHALTREGREALTSLAATDTTARRELDLLDRARTEKSP